MTMKRIKFLVCQDGTTIANKRTRVFLEDGTELENVRSISATGTSTDETVVEIRFMNVEVQLVDKPPKKAAR